MNSLLPYVEPFCTLLQWAKIEQKIWAQDVLWDLLRETLVFRFSLLFKDFDFQTCALAPLSIRRILFLEWHSQAIYSKVFEQNQSTEGWPRIETSYTLKWFKSSSISAKNRRGSKGLFSEKSGGFLQEPRKRVLVLDDVLSSGTTALDAFRKLKERHNIEAHLFVLFRTPLA